MGRLFRAFLEDDRWWWVRLLLLPLVLPLWVLLWVVITPWCPRRVGFSGWLVGGLFLWVCGGRLE